MIYTKDTITFCSLMMLSISAMATNIKDEKNNIPMQQNQNSTLLMSSEKDPGEEDFEQAMKHRNEMTRLKEGKNSSNYQQYLRLLSASAESGYIIAQDRLAQSCIMSNNYADASKWISKIINSDNEGYIVRILDICIEKKLIEEISRKNVDINDWFPSNKLASNPKLKIIHDEYQDLSKIPKELSEYKNQAEKIEKLQDQKNYKEMFERALNAVTQMNNMVNNHMNSCKKSSNKNSLLAQQKIDSINAISPIRSSIIKIIVDNCLEGKVDKSNKDIIIEFLEKNQNIFYSDEWNYSDIKGKIYLGLNDFENAFQVFIKMHEGSIKYVSSEICSKYPGIFSLVFLESDLFLKTKEQALDQFSKGDQKLIDMIDLTIMHNNHSTYKGADKDRYETIKQQWYQDIKKANYQSITERKELEKQQSANDFVKKMMETLNAEGRLF